MIDAGGKRVRPLFCLWGYRAAGGQDVRALGRVGAALEMLHTAALIHDDVLDRSRLRRGRPSSYRRLGDLAPEHAERFGAAAAILAGDLAQALSDELLAGSAFPPERIVAAAGLVDRARVDAVTGEFLDLLAVARGAGAGVDEAHISVPAPDAPSFVAMNKNTGELYWTDNSPGKNIMEGQWSNPAYAVVNGKGQVIFPGGDGWLYAFEPETGKPVWKFNCNPKNSTWKPNAKGTRNYLVATPVVHDNDCWWDMKKRGYQRPLLGFRAIHMPRNTGAGIILAGLSLVLGFALIWYIWWLAAVSAAALLVTTISHTFNYHRDFHIPAADVVRAEAERTELLAQAVMP